MFWNVYLNEKLIDTVWYEKSCTALYVKDGLVNHDGYNSAIKVYPCR